MLMDAAAKGASPTDVQLLYEVNRLLALMPPMEPLLQHDAEAMKWRGETTALLEGGTQFAGCRPSTPSSTSRTLAICSTRQPSTDACMPCCTRRDAV